MITYYIVNRVTIVPVHQYDTTVLRHSAELQRRLHQRAEGIFKHFGVEPYSRTHLVGGIEFCLDGPSCASPFVGYFPNGQDGPNCVGEGKIINVNTGEVVYDGMFEHVKSLDAYGNSFEFAGRDNLTAVERAGIPVILERFGIGSPVSP